MDNLLLAHRRFWILIVAGLLSIPVLCQLLGSAELQSSAEQRILAQRPTWPDHWSALLELPKKIDAFVNDQYGLRAEIMLANSLLRHVLHSSPNSSAYYGVEGWLFYNGDHSLRQVSRNPPRYEALKRFADLLSDLDIVLRQKNRRLVFGVAPNKESVYLEKLPWWLRAKTGPTEYDVLLAELAKTQVRTVDLRALLREAAQRMPVYYKTDSHWNMVGALMAYNALVAAAGQENWRLDPAVALQPNPRNLSGDLARYLGLHSYLSESDWRLTVDDLPQKETVFNDRTIHPTRVFDYNHEGPVVMIIGDSFSNRLFKYFLSPYVSRLVWTHHNECGFNGSLINRYQPDVVFYLPAERMIGCANGVVPKDLLLQTQSTPPGSR
ncbi:MAG: hypothetical protein RKO66_12210 [Candidatus Contendobacter sp.]|nr:hypothetical protein [Candidatus Contendobacter sp.]